jgi:hypothetical protein
MDMHVVFGETLAWWEHDPEIGANSKWIYDGVTYNYTNDAVKVYDMVFEGLCPVPIDTCCELEPSIPETEPPISEDEEPNCENVICDKCLNFDENDCSACTETVRLISADISEAVVLKDMQEQVRIGLNGVIKPCANLVMKYKVKTLPEFVRKPWHLSQSRMVVALQSEFF